MGSVVFSLADDAWYLLQRLAVQRRSTVEAVMTDLIRAEGDRSLPRVREGYQRRAQIAEEILRRRGIDPADDDYQQARAAARALLADVDSLHTGTDQSGPCCASSRTGIGSAPSTARESSWFPST